MFVKRSAEEIISSAVDLLSANTKITNFNAGAIARSLVEAMAPEYQTLYDFAQDVLDQGFVSKATGEQLDLIGELFNYPRRTETLFDQNTGEQIEQLIDDETYRAEIVKQVSAAVSSNEEALRLACLTTPGVQDIIGQEYTHGTGSFSFILVTQYGFDPESVKAEMLEKINQTKAFGVRPNIILPTPVPIEIELQLIFKETTTEAQKQDIAFNGRTHLFNYFGNFDIGQDFIYNDFVQEVMNLSDEIVDFNIISFSLNNQPVLLTNQTILDDERIEPKMITINT